MWGAGQPRRGFLRVGDLADAAVFLMDHWMDHCDGPGIVNVGTGQALTVSELAGLIREAVGFTGQIRYDASMPDGAPRKLPDMSRLARLGWRPCMRLREGIVRTCAHFAEPAGGALAMAV